MSQIKNLRLKIDDLKAKLGDKGDEEHTESSEDSDGEDIGPVLHKQAPHKKPRAGISAEVFGAYNKKEDFVARVFQKSAEVKDKLRKRLTQAFMFSALNDKELAVVIDAIEEAKFAAGAKVIVEGDHGDCMYVLESGSLNCTKLLGDKKEPTHLKTYAPGEGFGELALLYNCPRAATITAKEESVCWRLDRDTFNHIVKDAAQ